MNSLIFLLCVVSTLAALPDLNFKECEFKYVVNSDARANGEKSTDGSGYPWKVALYRHKNAADVPEYICGGSIVHPKVILTTAHCLYNEVTQDVDDGMMSVVAGQYHLSWEHTPLEQRRQVTRKFIPPSYAGRKYRYADDIALLALNDPLLLSNVTMPVCIDWDSKSNLTEADTYGTVVGWGQNRNGSISTELQVETQKYYGTKKCRASDLVSESFSVYITSDKFCGVPDDYSSTIGGAGFTIPHKTLDNKQQSYVYGVASVKEKTSNIIAFTSVKAHLKWLKETLSSILA